MKFDFFIADGTGFSVDIGKRELSMICWVLIVALAAAGFIAGVYLVGTPALIFAGACAFMAWIYKIDKN